jgi:hypothetical protein
MTCFLVLRTCINGCLTNLSPLCAFGYGPAVFTMYFLPCNLLNGRIVFAGFNSTATELFIRSQPINLFATAVWFRNNETLTTFVRLPVDAGRRVQILLYGQSPWLSLPREGIRMSHSLTVSTNAVDGPVPVTLIAKVPAIGSFNGTSRVSFSVAQAGQRTNVSLEFAAAMPLLQGDEVTLVLASFTVEPTNFEMLNGTLNLTAMSDGTLTFAVMKDIEASAPIRLDLSSVVIFLPTRGVDNGRCCADPKSTCCISISAKAAQGPVALTRVTSVPLVGALLDTELQFDPLIAGAAVNMTLIFTPTMVIHSGEHIVAILPGLSANATEMTAVVEQVMALNAPKIVSSAQVTWTQSQSQLVINFTQALAPNGVVRVTMGTLFNIPDTGIKANDKDFTLAINARSGPVPPTSIMLSPGAFGAGNFTNSSIAFIPLTAGSVTDVSLSFAATMTLVPGTTVELRLAGFIGPAQPAQFWVNLPWTATVRSTATGVTLQLVTNMTIRAETAVSILIPGSLSQLAVPMAGLRANGAGVLMSTNAFSGPVPPTPFQISPAVGSFLSSPSLTFTQARASEPCDMRLSFTPQMALASGEHVILGLTSFTGPNATFNIVDVQSSDPSAGAVISMASWSDGVLVLVVNSTIQENTTVALTIPASSGILLPVLGIAANTADITISTNAVAGPVLPVALSSTQAVGSFNESTRITFSPAKAGEVTEVTVAFTPMMNVKQSEVFEIKLPGFSLLSSNGSLMSAMQSPVRVSWVNGSEARVANIDLQATYNDGNLTLRFTFSVALLRLQSYSIRVPRPFGIKIPDVGVVSNDASYTIETLAVAGPVLPTRIARTQAIGSFVTQSLYFTPLVRSGTATDVKLSWMARMAVAAGETVSVYLPGFVASVPITDFPLAGTSNFSAASWSASSELLSFTASSTLPAHTAQLAELPSAAGLLMANVGVSYATTVFEITSNALAGPVPGTTIHEVQVVGSFQSTQLGFTPLAKAGDPTRITVSVVPRMFMRASETIELTLPDFNGNVEEVDQIFWSPFILYNKGTWNQAQKTLTMTLPADVPPGTLFTAAVSSTVGIRTPLLGVRTNQVTMTLSTDAAQGPAPPTSFERTQSVGSFGTSPRLVYSPESGGGRANTTASILASFMPQMRLSVNDRIQLFLPNFQGRPSATVVVESSNVAPQTFAARWSYEIRTVIITVLKDVPALTDIMLLLPTSMGIRLPEFGISANSATLTISTTAVDGPVPQTSIPVSPGIGYMKDLSIRFNQFCSLGELTTVEVITRFSSASGLAANEVVTVSLPGFTAADGAFAVTSDPVGLFEIASWTTSATSISFTSAADVAPNALVTLTVPSTANIRAPQNGVSVNQGNIRFASNSNAAPVSATPFSSVGAVGVIFDAGITFTETCQGMPTSLTAEVRASMALAAGDTVTISLLNNWPRGSDPVTIDSTGVVSKVQWVPDTADGSRQIILTMGRGVEANQAWSSGLIKIPQLSLPGNVGDPSTLTPSATVSARGALTSACAVKVMRFNDMTCNPSSTVSIFNSTSLEYSTNLTTVPTRLRLSFRMMQAASPGVTFVVSLPGFRLPAESAGPSDGFVSCVPNIFQSALSLQTGKVGVDLMLTLNASITPGTMVVATVAGAAGLRLPEMGTKANQDDLKITVQKLLLANFPWFGARDYSVSIASSPGVGVLMGTSLSFSKLAAGTAVDISLGFKFTLPLSKGDIVELFLDGFEGSDASSIVSTQGALTLRGSWSNTKSILSMTIDHPTTTIAPMTQATVVIPARTGVKLPAQGVRANQEAILVRINAAVASVPFIPVQTTPAVVPYRCMASSAFVSSGAVCNGNHTVRVCALSQADADRYASTVALPALRQVTETSCQEQGMAYCEAAGGMFGGVTQSACCRTVGAGDLAQCAFDSDCIGADNNAPTVPMTNIPVIQDQCCEFCAKDVENSRCREGNSETACSGKCVSSKPCYGYAVSFVQVEIKPEEGGAVVNALGIGFTVPAGVWPPEAGPATMQFVPVPDTPPMMQGASFAGGAVTFGPSPMTFPEPGVNMVLPYTDDGDDTTVVRAFKLVNGEWVMQPFIPVIDPVTGTASVKTLSFSTYVLMAVPASFFAPATPAPTPAPTPVVEEPVDVVPPTPRPTPTASSGDSSAGVIGGVVGGIGLVIVLGVAFFIYRQRRRQEVIKSAGASYRQRLMDEDEVPLKPVIMEVGVCT